MILPSFVKAATVNLNCDFEHVSGYRCRLSRLVIAEDVDEMATFNITGNHLIGQADSTVTTIVVERSIVPFIISQLFETFSEAIIVRIDRAILRRIQPNSFVNASSLRRIFITDNPLDFIPAQAFLGVPQLDWLILSQNSIEKIDENAFEGLENLWFLVLENNRLRELPKDVFKPLTGVGDINLDNNLLEILDESLFQYNVRLRQLRISGNRINAVAATAFDNINALSVLLLQSNRCVDQQWIIIGLVTLEDIVNDLEVCVRNFEGIDK